ncbi:MAG: GNAT family N-acetyltransferase [Verrucomicrobiota bacterium]
MNSYREGPETERLRHRALVSGDAEAFYRLNSDPEVMRYTAEAPLESVEAAREAIVTHPDFETVGYGRWACVLKGEESLCGFCGLKYLEDLDAVDLGFRFFPSYWGRGLATEACEASLRFGFEVLGLEEIIALVLPENGASIRVLEKVGMKFEGDFDYDGWRALRYRLGAHEERGCREA